LIALRHSEPLIQDGVYRQLLPTHPQVWVYLREGEGERLLVVNNFYGTACEVELPEQVITDGMLQRLVISNFPDCETRSRQLFLRPYESFVLHLTEH